MTDQKTLEYYRQYVVPKYTKMVEDELFIYNAYRSMQFKNIDTEKALKFWGTQQASTRIELLEVNKKISQTTDEAVKRKLNSTRTNLKVKERFVENQIRQLVDGLSTSKKNNKSI